MTITTPQPATHPAFAAAERLAPIPATRQDATREAWIRHYAALSLAAHVEFRAALRTVSPAAESGSRPDLGYLITIGVSATAAAVALAAGPDAPGLIFDLTPEAGALNGEWEDWLDETLESHGINPADIDRNLTAADFTPAEVAR